MDNEYRWSPASTSASREVRDDVASVAQMWVTATYDDLRRAGPDRGTRVRGVLDRYVIPWFGPQTTSVGDITYFMVHEWLLTLVGRQRSELGNPPSISEIGMASEYRELSLREAAEAGAVSVATVRRRWRDGELTGAYRDSHGYVRVPELATAALRRAKRERPVGLSQAVVSDALWVLRRSWRLLGRTGWCRLALIPPKG